MSGELRAWLASLKEMGMQPGLERTATLLARLKMPQQNFPSVHVAGSNGKGSCCAILANAFTLTGTCTGLFSSPHLCSENERVRVDGVPISDELFDDCLSKIIQAAALTPETNPTYYEATFLVAMLAFSSLGVERAIIETGLGGRLDATRLVDADCTILTELALEHTEYLGNTLAEIAREKVAIVRQGRPFIASWTYDADARSVIESAVRDHHNAWWWRADRSVAIRFAESNQPFRPLPPVADFDGWIPYKKEAAMLARTAAMAMNEYSVYEAIELAVNHTHWPGRMQWLDYEGVPILLDAAHNPSGMARTCEQIRFQKSRDENPMPGAILIGCTQQNEMHDFLHPLAEMIVDGRIEHIFVTQPSQGRRSPVESHELAEAIAEHGLQVNLRTVEDSKDAFIEAHNQILKLDSSTPVPLLCIGSLYLIGDILKIVKEDSLDAMNTLIPIQGEDGTDPIP
jgi:dihydrofolate synthase/folylpolyglutamate synthase